MSVDSPVEDRRRGARAAFRYGVRVGAPFGLAGGLLAFALVAVVIAFLLSACEAAIFRMSHSRARELYDEGRSGSTSLLVVIDDSPAYLAVLTFLRVVAEAASAVLITIAVLELVDLAGRAATTARLGHGAQPMNGPTRRPLLMRRPVLAALLALPGCSALQSRPYVEPLRFRLDPVRPGTVRGCGRGGPSAR